MKNQIFEVARFQQMAGIIKESAAIADKKDKNKLAVEMFEKRENIEKEVTKEEEECNECGDEGTFMYDTFIGDDDMLPSDYMKFRNNAEIGDRANIEYYIEALEKDNERNTPAPAGKFKFDDEMVVYTQDQKPVKVQYEADDDYLYIQYLLGGVPQTKRIPKTDLPSDGFVKLGGKHVDISDIIKKVGVVAEKKEKPGLWANIRAKRARGEAPAKKGSKAYKSAVAAAKEINKADK